MCECTYNFIRWKNRVRTMTCGFGFCSVLYVVGFGSVRILAHLLLSGLVWFLAKSGFCFGPVLLRSGSLPSRVKTERQRESCVCCTSHANCDIRVVCCLPGTIITSVTRQDCHRWSWQHWHTESRCWTNDFLFVESQCNFLLHSTRV